MHRALRITLLLTLTLTACSTPSPEIRQPTDWSEATFGTYMSDLVEDVSELINEKALGLDVITNLPDNAPGLDNAPADQLVTGLDTFVLNTVLAPLNNNSRVSELPRGHWQYDPYEESWSLKQNTDDLILAFPFGNIDSTVSQIQLVIDWDARKETLKVAAPYAMKEVPRALDVYWTKDGIKGGLLRVDASWKHGHCGPLYEVKSIDIKGVLGHADLSDFDIATNNQHTNGAIKVAISYQVNEEAGSYGSNYIPTTNGRIWIGKGNQKAEFSWDVTAYAKIDRGPECFKGDLELLHGDATLHLNTKLNGQKDHVEIDMNFYNFVETPHISVDVKDGFIKVNGEEAVHLEGTLGDANKNYVIGDDLMMTYANGEMSTLEIFLTEQLQLSNLWFPGL